jgi:aldehyde:ferredoxin oxidoreductase
MIVCSFTPLYSDKNLAEALSSLFTETFTSEDLKEAAIRIMCHERLFNMREGITEKDDTLPDRLLKEPKPDGPTKGSLVPLKELKEEFYKAMGYDLATGNPTDALLAKLEIEK